MLASVCPRQAIYPCRMRAVRVSRYYVVKSRKRTRSKNDRAITLNPKQQQCNRSSHLACLLLVIFKTMPLQDGRTYMKQSSICASRTEARSIGFLGEIIPLFIKLLHMGAVAISGCFRSTGFLSSPLSAASFI